MLKQNLVQTDRRLALKTAEADQLRQQRDEQRAAFEAEFERRGERLQETVSEADVREERFLQQIEALEGEIESLREEVARLGEALGLQTAKLKETDDARLALSAELETANNTLAGEREKLAEAEKAAAANLQKEKQARGLAEAELSRLKENAGTLQKQQTARTQLLEKWKAELDMACDAAIKQLEGEIVINESAGELVVRLSANKLFASDVVVLDETATASLDEISAWIAALLKKGDATGWRVAVVGHADNQPIESLPFANNTELSIRRAFAVALQLQRSVPKDRISVAAFGEHDPIAKNNTVDGRRKNRRVELVLTKNL